MTQIKRLFVLGIAVSFHLFSLLGTAQTAVLKKKHYLATRIFQEPVIDGKLSDSVWAGLPVGKDFTMMSPAQGRPERASHPTEFKIGYTDEAIFVAAYMYDYSETPIRREFTKRDDISATDYIVFDINTYNDGENQLRFVVTTAGGMMDAKMKGPSEDYDYNVVWDAKVSIDSQGWYAEMKIPFSALRFPKAEEQLWSIQLGRIISSLNETYMWSPVNREVGILPHYNGLLSGIAHIDPPFRLGLYPFVAAGTETYKNAYRGSFSAGLDLKYGINDAFTLDMTLVPDFGQTAFDEVELNLGPFEQTFGEKRAFFTEGTELFNKGNLFYSRRIGGAPLGYVAAIDDVRENELLLENPEETRLLNAFKISGRTKSGLGLGLFNAISAQEEAVYQNRETGATRKVVTAPFTNYNIIVLDQQFQNNSSLSFVNTNVLREGAFRDANVSAGLFDIYTKNSAFNISGEAKVSQLYFPDATEVGFASQLSVQRSRGSFRYGVAHELADRQFDINDLGVNFTNNYNNFFWNTSYQTFEPKGFLNQYKVELYGNHQRRFRPSVTVRNGVGVRFSAATTKRLSFGGFLDFNTEYRDYFESRTEGRFVRYPKNFIGEVYMSSDYRKPLALDANFLMSQFVNSSYNKIRASLRPRIRISEKILLRYSLEMEWENDRNSFVARRQDSIVFGLRSRMSVENGVSLTYNFNPEQSLSLSGRNFWTVAQFSEDSYSLLQPDGHLRPVGSFVSEDINPNARFNIWNLDLRYTWYFAPGSELSILYRHAVDQIDHQARATFFESADTLFSNPLKHNLSVRVVYYLDYNKLRRAFRSS